MIEQNYYGKLVAAISLLILATSTWAASLTTIPDHATAEITQLYHTLNTALKKTMPQRLDVVSAFFLNRPYLLTALGEGDGARYDDTARYRTDAFDCETYVDTVIAIALTNNADSFKQCIDKVRYLDSHISFTNRNHFTALDWNHNNQQQGLIRDITASFNHIEIAHSVTTIDKAQWYQHLGIDTIRLNGASTALKNQRLRQLQRQTRHLRPQQSILPYLPLNQLFDAQGVANEQVFNQIPDGAIIEIVRPNWDLTQQIGTRLDISHLGFAFWENHQLMFRQASSLTHAVISTPLIDYLRAALQSPTIKGIHILEVVPTQSTPQNCQIHHTT